MRQTGNGAASEDYSVSTVDTFGDPPNPFVSFRVFRGSFFCFRCKDNPRNTRNNTKREPIRTTQPFDNTLIIASWTKPLLASVVGL